MPKSETVSNLIANFSSNFDSYCRHNSAYNETEVRSDFINPFFEALGWDILNSKGVSRPLRQVISEANVMVENATKKPDYEFRLNGTRKFFVEAKKPSVDISTSAESALQLRRYGWSANLPISVLFNFRQISIYDCTVKPNEGDSPQVALITSFTYEEFDTRFDEIYSLLSQESVASGKFDADFEALISSARGTQTFDNYFLDQIEKWRLTLAINIHTDNPDLTTDQINYLVQVFLNRIVFLRICEDRNLEEYATLKNIEPSKAVQKLLELFREADAKYDSGLFDLLTDTLTPSVAISNEVLLEIVNDLYYPQSPYSFSVVSPTILGSIYDRFISKSIDIENDEVKIITKPEVKQANGVYTTPPSVVKSIVETSIKLYGGDILTAKILDPAVGSGIFLVEVYEQLLQKHLDRYLANNEKTKLRQNDSGDAYLNLSTKRGILLDQVYGVDIDAQAGEVAKFSLYLKLLEDVTNGEIMEYLEAGTKALPHLESNIKTGNSLIESTSYLEFHNPSVLERGEMEQISPFDWPAQFPEIFDQGGFNIIVANPPYTRIQNLMYYSPHEAHYYQSPSSKYLSSHANNFDKYQLFVERGFQLLATQGILGYIVPHKFMTNQAGQPLRSSISGNSALKSLVHFGSLQLFPGQATTYTCLIFLAKNRPEKFTFERVDTLFKWQNAQDEVQEFDASHISDSPWIFPSANERIIFDQIESSFENTLEDIASIFVGLQTSADKVFIRTPESSTGEVINFTDYNGKQWVIESGITRSAILDLDSFDNYSQINPNRFIIFPYKKLGDTYVEMPEDELAETYPLAYAYLSAFKNELSQRSMQGDGAWFRYGRSQSINKFNRPKLIIKNPALRATVAYDQTDIMFTGGGNGPYYGVRSKGEVSINFLHALLNSELFNSWVKARSSEFRGGYFSYGKQFIQNFPIPDLNKNAVGVGQIDSAWESILRLPKEAETPHDQALLITQRNQLLSNINEKIDKLYGLNAWSPEMTGARS
jgi:type I restriction-modification system DNA methylase subunit